ncbi:MAG: hypothetical protein LAQ69_51805 [Acidobacteriia bacterium]|nr:hypothetical protein [Terriglobia bacterium]
MLTHSASASSGVHVASDADSGTGTPEHRPAVALFVSTALGSWTGDQLHVFARDVQINDTAFRRLDPEYYAWLRSRMNLARSAHQAGQIDGEAYDELRSKFNGIHAWALAHFGERVLADAVRILDARDYQPPVAEPDTPPSSPIKRNADADGLPESIAMVDAICERALALGWKRERLYGTGRGRLFSQDRGLVSLLRPGDQVGEVTLQSIEIIGAPPTEVRQRFYNPDVDQPWIRRTRPGN